MTIHRTINKIREGNKTMPKFATTAEAKNTLPKLIHSAEAGEDIHISRHGIPVAVLISEERYQQAFGSSKHIFQSIMEWRANNNDIELTNDEVDSWRDKSPARDFSWD